MDVKTLAEQLKTISLRSGVATDADFVGVSPLDVIASYTVALSGGRIVEDRDILARVAGSGNLQHFIGSVSRASVPVPSQGQIEKVQSGTLNEYKPAPEPPSKQSLVAAECRRELRKRLREFYRNLGKEPTEASLKEIDGFDDWRAIRTFIAEHGRELYKHDSHAGLNATIERCESPEEFIATVTEAEPDYSDRPRHNWVTGEVVG